MKKLLFLTAVLIFISYHCSAVILQESSIMSIIPHITPGSLVIFDIDNTLARAPSALGSDEWFSYLVNQKIAAGYTHSEAINSILPVCYYVQFNVPLILVEKEAPSLLMLLSNKKVRSMGLTSRSIYLAERTHEQLHNIDLNFFMPIVNQEEVLIPGHYPCLYKYHILFSGENDKGTSLLTLFDIFDYRPSRIIFIDDKLYNIESVARAAEKRNIDYVGIRYSGCDHYVTNFNPTLATQQLQELRKKNHRYHCAQKAISPFSSIFTVQK